MTQGKGDTRRPARVSSDTLAANWARTFGGSDITPNTPNDALRVNADPLPAVPWATWYRPLTWVDWQDWGTPPTEPNHDNVG